MLLTGTEHTGGLAALRALRAAGYAPWAAVTSAGALGARSRAAAGVVAVPDARLEPAAFARAVPGLMPQRNTAHAMLSLSDPRAGLAYMRRVSGRLARA